MNRRGSAFSQRGRSPVNAGRSTSHWPRSRRRPAYPGRGSISTSTTALGSCYRWPVASTTVPASSAGSPRVVACRRLEGLSRVLRLWFGHLQEILPVARALEAAAITGEEGSQVYPTGWKRGGTPFASPSSRSRMRAGCVEVGAWTTPPTGSGCARNRRTTSTWSGGGAGQPGRGRSDHRFGAGRAHDGRRDRPRVTASRSPVQAMAEIYAVAQ